MSIQHNKSFIAFWFSKNFLNISKSRVLLISSFKSNVLFLSESELWFSHVADEFWPNTPLMSFMETFLDPYPMLGLADLGSFDYELNFVYIKFKFMKMLDNYHSN